jgi:hypothetical protein
MYKRITITHRERLALIQTLLNPKERSENHELRLARRLTAEALGVRRGRHWDVFSVSDAGGAAQLISLMAIVNGEKRRVRSMADRWAIVSEQMVDLCLGAMDRHGKEVEDEDAVLDLELKLRAEFDATDGAEVLPGVDDPAVGDEIIDDVPDEELLAPEGVGTTE